MIGGGGGGGVDCRGGCGGCDYSGDVDDDVSSGDGRGADGVGGGTCGDDDETENGKFETIFDMNETPKFT